ncbi:sterol desaturase family protein [Salinisphaera hydrothermalis]|uniref:Fatty acid hydroxylase n=1 Tax=Salinisphaera hydrothermalis (strain C41B8) TaxID=1304275 RepID=A0A084IHT8_SALHC|nr:sterol desaturase family protein [Salinisphaera hydrothermalis]KEZ76272.1 fatty acid hydroxylase [Salinisphaera hydrothermalis C41B8]
MSAYEGLIAVLVLGLSIVMGLEIVRPYRKRGGIRWPNILLGAISHVIEKLVLPVGLGAIAMHWPYGLLHALTLPAAGAVVAGVLLLDAVKYGQHVLFHKVYFFWRFHRVHHSDHAIDASTALRMHPGQALVGMGVSLSAVLALGLPMLSVLIFALLHEIVLLFTHANLGISRNIDRMLRCVVVSPRMHWIHHSSEAPREHDHNYGICFPFWDWLFGTYIAESRAGEDGFAFGVDGQPVRVERLGDLLWLPVSWRQPMVSNRSGPTDGRDRSARGAEGGPNGPDRR